MKRASSTAGIALVLVLLFLVLIAGLIVAFFDSARTESRAAAGLRDTVTARQLGETAVNLAQAQISDGTKSTLVAGSSPGAGNPRLAWASQPGLIRTWDESGRGWKLFKLYSARDMVADFRADGTYSVAAELENEVPGTWPAQRAHFTDLNEPVLVEDADGSIVRDARALRASYPIIDPLATLPVGDVKAIDGFTIVTPPGSDAKPDAAADPTRALPGRSANPAPMPVRWIYVLEDGTLTVPTGSADEGRIATWDGAPAALSPSATNAIVGRIAFWTDDETCKLNLNTASEPTPWDTPRAVTIQDLRYGQYQPATKEYQRYPGHPFMTALSPVLLPGEDLNPRRPSEEFNIAVARKQSIYGLIPRVQKGGTDGALAAATGVLATDEDRLFASVDELLFNPARGQNDTDLIDPVRLRRAKFFLTASSRAPELTLHGLPRMSMWPVHRDATKRTPFDRLAVFCASTGARPFCIQRENASSPTADYANIARNGELYAYLQRLTSGAVPGFGGSFAAKWGADRDQVLTEVFDYLRCVNLRDLQTGATSYASRGQVAPLRIGDTQGFGRFHTISQFGFHFICAQDGVDGASDTANPKLKPGERAIEAAFIFTPFSPALGWFELQEQVFFEVDFTSAFTIDGQDLKMTDAGRKLDNGLGATFHGRRQGGPGGLRGVIKAFGSASYPLVSKAVPRVKIAPGKTTMTFSGGTAKVRVYAGTSANAANLIQTFNVDFPRGTFPVPNLVRTDTTAFRGCAKTVMQQWWTFGGYTSLPPGSQFFRGRYAAPDACPHAPGPEYTNATRRFGPDINNNQPGFKEGGLFRAEDVVRTIVPEHGDFRLTAAQREVKATEFVQVHPDWNGSSRFLHVFSAVTGPHHHYGFCNEPGPPPAAGIPGAAADDQLIPSSLVKYHYSRLPEIRPGAGKLHNRWNDFDNGIAQWMDGPLINKPDEGNQASQNSSYTYFSWTFTTPKDFFFSPSRLVPSAGMLGSLPTGVKRGRPWETLLFRPEVRLHQGQPHPGTLSPPDHLLMDLFWMPVLEPYAISEPFSTAGKVNLNYEIAPFSYLRRTTALHGALKAEEPLVLPNAASKIYKLWDHETNDHPYLPNNSRNQDPQVRADWDKAYKGQAPFDRMRRPIDVEKTLAQAEERFASGEAFRSATQLCELHLVRDGETLADYRAGKVWDGALITGDNTRERPYTNLYARLTTRSNTFTVHVRAQSLRYRPARGSAVAHWDESRGDVLGEYRGATTLERYIDPGDPALPDAATDATAVLDGAYRWRVVATKRFNP